MTKTNYVQCYDDWGKVYQNCKFHDPWGRDSCAGVWSISEHEIFFSLSTLGHGSDKLNIKQKDPGKVCQDCKFHYYWSWGSYASAWLYKSYSDYALPSTLSIYITLIGIVLEIKCCFPCCSIVDFHLFYDGAADIQKRAHLQEVSVESLILGWPLRPFGILLTSWKFQFISNLVWNMFCSRSILVFVIVLSFYITSYCFSVN